MPQSHNLSSIWKPEWLISRGLSLLLGIGLLLVLQGCRPTEGTIRKGESVVITLSLKKGQFQAVTLEQRDSDLTMALTSPTDKRLHVNYFDGTVGEEKLFLKAEETGAYKLAVSLTSAKEGLTGHYKLTISSLRMPTAQDDDRWEAQRLYRETFQLYEELKQDDPEFMQKRDHVVKTYEGSISKWRAAGEPALSAVTLIRLGQVWHDQNQFEMSRTYYQQALQEAQTSADLRGQADALANIAAVSDRLSKTWEDKQQAKQFYDQALGLSRQAKELRAEASTLSNLGRYSRGIGQYQAALDYYLQALDKFRALGNREHEGIVLANLGAAYRSLGLKAEAEAVYNEALTIHRELGDTANQALCHNGLGRVLDLLGDRTKEEKERARQKFEEAVSLGKESVDLDVYENNLGTIYYELGMIYKRLGEPDKARGLFNQSLTHLQTAFDLKGRERVYHKLTSLGLLAHARGQKQEARRYLEKALVSSREYKVDYQQAIVLAAQARIARDDHRLAEAKTRIEEALRIVESVAVSITSLDLRSSYTTAQRHFYDLHADILLRLLTQKPRKQPFANYHKVAWAQIERARMTALQGSLDSLDLLPSQGIAQTDVAKMRELRSSIQLIRTLPDSSEKLEQLSKLTTRYQELETQIARQISGAANHPLTVNPDRLPEIQAALKEDTLLLEYSLGEDRSYLWVVTPTNFEVFALPGQAQLESVARQIRDAIASPQGIGAETRAASVKLSNWLLRPVASRLGDKKLLIVADRILDSIQFGILPEPTAAPAATQSDSRMLIKSHEIVYLPTAMTLLSLPGSRETSQASESSTIIIADPVFNARHPKAKAANCKEGQPPASSAGAKTSEADRMAGELSPVPFGDLERAAFREAVFGPLPSSSRHELFGFQAKLGNVLADKLVSHRNVIFYTHGIFNEREQGITGLALSRLNEQCVVEEKYLLRLIDIYNLKLSADLVTLIACDTARNQTMRGFGLGSIARGFMSAGTARVLGTLWKVNDQSSLELVTRFYRNRRAGQTASQALRNAQLSFLNDNNHNWRLPYYWAGFVLMGDFN